MRSSPARGTSTRTPRSRRRAVTGPIAKLLDGSPYQDAFKNGIYTHSFLNAADYHRYHVPVAGEIKEVRKIEGRVYMNLIRKADGSFGIIDGETYQYNQERGLIVIDSPEVGLVAVLPIGMGFVSSVNLAPEIGAKLQEGDEFGFFIPERKYFDTRSMGVAHWDNGSMLGSWKPVAELVGVAVAGRANADKEAAGERDDDWPESRRNVAQPLRPNPAFTDPVFDESAKRCCFSRLTVVS
jgi:Phosphatidylserine decarboxylase